MDGNSALCENTNFREMKLLGDVVPKEMWLQVMTSGKASMTNQTNWLLPAVPTRVKLVEL